MADQDDLSRAGAPRSHQSGSLPCSRRNVSALAAFTPWLPDDSQKVQSLVADRL
jgi:hypothetical protein